MTNTAAFRCFWAATWLACIGCSGGDSGGLRVGADPEDDGRAGNGPMGVDNPLDGLPPQQSENALGVEIQDDAGMTVELIVIACGGACIELQAVASGGNPPYAYRWDDGSTEQTRTLCFDEASTVAVSATDTAIDTEEFKRDALTTRTEADASVLACPDAGVTDGSMPEGNACESLVTEGLPWDTCDTAADWVIPLPAPLEAGESYSLRVTGEGLFVPDGAWDIEIWGSNNECTLETRLGAMRELNGPNDVTMCLVPEQRFTHLVYHLVSGSAAKLSTFEYTLCSGCESP